MKPVTYFQGKYLFKDGNVYVGQFKNNKKHGLGKYWIKDDTDPEKKGTICEGYFEDGLLHGKCTIVW